MRQGGFVGGAHTGAPRCAHECVDSVVHACTETLGSARTNVPVRRIPREAKHGVRVRARQVLLHMRASTYAHKHKQTALTPTCTRTHAHARTRLDKDGTHHPDRAGPSDNRKKKRTHARGPVSPLWVRRASSSSFSCPSPSSTPPPPRSPPMSSPLLRRGRVTAAAQSRAGARKGQQGERRGAQRR